MKFAVAAAVAMMGAGGACDEPSKPPADPPMIVTSKAAVWVDEGTTQSVEITLDRAPAGIVTVGLVATGLTRVSPSQLVFTADDHDVPQSVTLEAPQDPDLADNADVVTLATDGGEAEIMVTRVDDDAQMLLPSATSIAVTEGQTSTFTVALAFAPAGPVTLALSTANAAVATVSPATLTFAPETYATPQTVTVAGTQDGNVAPGSTMLFLSNADLPLTQLPVAVTDDDRQQIILGTTSVMLAEGTSFVTSIKLAYDPGGTVMIQFASTNPKLGVGGNPIAFNSGTYSFPLDLYIGAGVDRDALDETATITATEPTSGATATISAMVDDNFAKIAYGFPTDFMTYVATGPDPGPVIAVKVTVTQAAQLDTMGIFTSASSPYRMAVYRDAGGVPGALVDGTQLVSPVYSNVGDSPIAIAPVPITPGDYWIAFRVGSALVNAATATPTAVTCTRNQQIPDLETDWPTTFGPATCATAPAYNVYIDTKL